MGYYAPRDWRAAELSNAPKNQILARFRVVTNHWHERAMRFGRCRCCGRDWRGLLLFPMARDLVRQHPEKNHCLLRTNGALDRN